MENADTRKAIRLALQDHASHRSLFGWAMDDKQPDLTWSWKESERQALFLAEAGSSHQVFFGVWSPSFVMRHEVVLFCVIL